METQLMLDRYSDDGSDGESYANEDDIFLSTQRPVLGELIWRGKSFPLYEGDNLIGRDNVCEVKIDHKSISGKHAEIIVHPSGSSTSSAAGTCILRDLRSSNGTFLESPKGSEKYQKLSVLNNGKSLEDGGKVRFGMVSCTFRYAGVGTVMGNQEVPLAAPSKKMHSMEETQILNDITLIDEDEDEDEDKEDNGHSVNNLAARTQTAADDETITDDEGVTMNEHLNAHTEPVGFGYEDTVTEDEDDVLVEVPPGATFVRVDGSSTIAHPTGSAQLPTQIDDHDLEDYRPPILPPEGDGTEVEENEDDEDETMSQDLMEPITVPEELPVQVRQETSVPILDQTPEPTPVQQSHQQPSVPTNSLASGAKSVSKRQSFLADTDTEDEEEIRPTTVVDELTATGISDEPELQHPEPERAPEHQLTEVATEPEILVEEAKEEVRKSGRPRKTNLTFTASTDARYEQKLQEEAEDKEIESTPRKRNSKQVAITENKLTPPSTSSKSTRGRGKQSKATLPVIDECANADSLDLDSATSHSRKRSGTPDQNISAVQKVEETIEESGATPTIQEEEAPVAKKGRGRQKKVIETVALTEDAKVENNENETTAAERKKRGAGAIDEEPTPDKAKNEELVETKAEIGRPSKRSKNVTDSANAEAHTISPVLITEEPVAESSSSSASVRGRKKTVPVPENVAVDNTQIRAASPLIANDVQAGGSVAVSVDLMIPIRILFTKVEETTYSKQLKKIPNIEVTTDARIATHCITTKELKRTPKLMVALNSSILFILNEQWIVDSAKAGRPLAIVDTQRIASDQDKANYLKNMRKSPYLIRDTEKEQLWSFELAQTLTQIRCSLSSAGERHGPGIFSNIAVFCTKGLCGSKAPSEDEMQQIVESGQGIWLKSLTEFNNDEEKTSGKKKASKVKQISSSQESASADVGNKTLVVISHESLVKKEIKKDVLDTARNSGAKGIYSVELLFQAVLRQELNLNENILDGYSF